MTDTAPTPFAGKSVERRARIRADAIRWREQLDQPQPARRPIFRSPSQFTQFRNKQGGRQKVPTGPAA